MPRPRFEKLAAEKQARILETAAKEFAPHGFHEASLNHILAAAGISKGAAYYYFDDKADLFGAVLQHYLMHIVSHVDLSLETLDRGTFWPKMAELYRQGLDHAYEQPWLLPLMKSMWKSPGVLSGLPAGMQISLTAIREWTQGIVRRGQEVGAVRDDLPLDLLLTLLFSVDEACDRWILDRIGQLERPMLEELSDRMFDLLRRMFEPRYEPWTGGATGGAPR